MASLVWPFHNSTIGNPPPATGSGWRNLSIDALCRAGTPEPFCEGATTENFRTVGNLDKKDEASLVYKATLADSCGRYGDILCIYEDFIQKFSPKVVLNVEERALLSVGLKGSMDAARRARRAAPLDELEAAWEVEVRREFVERIDAEVKSLHNRARRLILDSGLLRTARDRGRHEDVAFYERMLGDYARYAAEVDDGDTFARDEARRAYSRAGEAALSLHPSNPVRLSVALNYSVFLSDPLHEFESARDVALRAVACARAKKCAPRLAEAPSTCRPDLKIDAETLLAQIQSNLAYWDSLTVDGLEAEANDATFADSVPIGAS